MPSPDPVYLDYNATAPLLPAARDALLNAAELIGNPSSVHRFGRSIRAVIEDAREHVADLVGVTPADVVFTSGGTEANNLALRGSLAHRVIVSAIEHPSVLAAAPDAHVIPVDEDGIVDLDALTELLAAGSVPSLVSVMLANNETGVIQPIREIASLAHAAGALVHCDAVQAAGRTIVDATALGADYISISGHKLGGAPGIGALICRPDVPVTAATVGGGQERRRRAGTENVPGIAAFGAAAAAAADSIADQPRLRRLRDCLESVAAKAPGVRVYGQGADRLANTSCIGLSGVTAETQIMALDLAGVAVSAGAACSSGKVSPSHVLRAMGVEPDEAACAIRVSLGWRTTEADISRFLAAWGDLARRVGRAA